MVSPPPVPTSPAVSGSGPATPAAPAAPTWVRVLVGVGLLAVAFGVAALVWTAVASTTGQSLLPGRRPSGPRPDVVLAAVGSSLKLLVPALVLGVALGAGLGALGAITDRLQADAPVLGALVSAVAWAGRLPWAALSPFVLAALLFFSLARNLRAPLVAEQASVFIVTLAGLPALLVGAAVQDRWRAGEWRDGLLAGLAAAGRSVPYLAGSLALVELVLNWPGLGWLLVSTGVMRLAGVPVVLLVILLALGFAGQLVGVLGDGLAGRPRATRGNREPAARGELLLALVLLAIPALLLLASLAVSASSAAQVNLGGRGSGPLGGDLLGRDVFARLMVGLRNTAGGAIGAAFLAWLVGCTWGGVAALAGRAGGTAGEVIADVLVAPAWVGALVPIVPAVFIVMLATTLKAPIVLVIALLLAPRVALGVRDLVEGWVSPAAGVRAAAGMLLLTVGVAVVLLVGVSALGLQRPTDVSLGATIYQSVRTSFATNLAPLIVGALLVMGTAGPCLFAGWALLRPCRTGRARAWALLQA